MYNLPADLERVKEEAAHIAGFVVILDHWPSQVIQSRLLLEMAASYSCERQQEWAKAQGKQLCNDLAAYNKAFVTAFCDAYESMITALQSDESKHAKYLEVFGGMSVGEAVQTVLTYPKEKEEVTHER